MIATNSEAEDRLAIRVMQLEKELKELKEANKEFTWESNKAIADLVKETIKLKKTIEGFRKGYADLNNYSDNLKKQLGEIHTRKDLLDDEYIKVQKENNKLEQQLSNIKYLDEDEVSQMVYRLDDVNYSPTWKEIIQELIDDILTLAIPNQPKLNRQEVNETIFLRLKYDDELKSYWGYHEDICDLITAICNLAVIDRDKIVEVLKNNAEQFINYSNSPMGEIHSSPIYYLHNVKFNKAADEIISAIGGK